MRWTCGGSFGKYRNYETGSKGGAQRKLKVSSTFSKVAESRDSVSGRTPQSAEYPKAALEKELQDPRGSWIFLKAYSISKRGFPSVFAAGGGKQRF